MYDKLCTIYADTTATGSSAHPSTNDPSYNEEEESEQSKSSHRKREYLNDDEDTSKDTFPSKKRSSASSELSFALRQYSEVSKKKIDMMEKMMASRGDVHEGSHFNLLKESVSALDNIEGIDGEFYAKAIDKFQHEVWRALFLEMPEHRRKDWVLSLK